MGSIWKQKPYQVWRTHSQHGASCILETFPNDAPKPFNTAFLKYSLTTSSLAGRLCQGAKNTGNKMPSESTIQVFPFARLCMFSRSFPNGHATISSKTLLANFYAKSQHSHLKPEDPALTPSKATSWHFNRPRQVQLFCFYSFPLPHCRLSSRYPIPSTKCEDRTPFDHKSLNYRTTESVLHNWNHHTPPKITNTTFWTCSILLKIFNIVQIFQYSYGTWTLYQKHDFY